MILRRLTENLKIQNWTAIGIELVIVVLGVFIGIQVANWNEARNEHALERFYLTQLADDIGSEVVEMDGIIRSSRWAFAVNDDILEAATGTHLPTTAANPGGTLQVPARIEGDSAGGYAPSLAMIMLATLDGSRSTYETMISTGGIGLLRDKALLVRIQQYYARVDEVRDFERVLEQRNGEYVLAQHRAGLSASDLLDIDGIATVMRTHPELLATAKTYRMLMAYHVVVITDLRGRAQALVEDLQARR